MDWLLENMGKMLPLVLAALYFWLSSRKGRTDKDDTEAPDGSDEMERARRIQEEIRRRIFERQRGDSPGPHVAPPVLVEESLHQQQERQVRPSEGSVREAASVPHEVEPTVPDDRGVLEHQARLLEQFERAQRLVEAQKRAATRPRPTPAKRHSFWNTKEGKTDGLRTALLRDLKSPTGLRRAILLREVLGEPVGLRRGPLPQK